MTKALSHRMFRFAQHDNLGFTHAMKNTFFKLSTFAAIVSVGASLCAAPSFAQQVNAYCSTNQSWCEMAATEFTKATGVKVVQTHLDRADPVRDDGAHGDCYDDDGGAVVRTLLWPQCARIGGT